MLVQNCLKLELKNVSYFLDNNGGNVQKLFVATDVDFKKKK